MKKKIMLLMALIVVSMNGVAGLLMRDAVVVELANSRFNSAAFTLRVQGGTGVCSTATWITFPESKAQSPGSHNQAFATALAALTTGKKIRIHNYEDNDCEGANFISIYK